MPEVFACHNPSLKKKKRKILVCKLISNEEIDALLPNFHCSIFKTANGLCKSCFFPRITPYGLKQIYIMW